jgi:hypothetical protein
MQHPAFQRFDARSTPAGWALVTFFFAFCNPLVSYPCLSLEPVKTFMTTKKLLFIFSLCSAIAGPFASSGFSQPASAGPSARKTVSAEPTSFDQVTRHLDPGGSLYVYLSTEEMLQGLSDQVTRLRGIVEALPMHESGDRENLGKVFDIITHLIKDSGIEEVSGFGASSIAREKNYYHSVAMLHHYPGKGNGFMWSVFGKKAHPLTALDMLPATTGIATFCDVDLAQLWSVIRKEASQSGFPQADEVVNKIPEEFEHATDLKWEQVLKSLGGEFGFVLTLDPAKSIPLPLPGADEPLELPEPGLMLVIKVKDDTIFNRIDDALKNTGQDVVSSDKGGVKMRTVNLPFPIPVPLRPSVASSAGYLFIATTDTLIQDALAVKKGDKPGLKTTEEFKRLATDVPDQGNHFSFVSQRFGKTMLRIQRAALPLAASAAPGAAQAMQSFMNNTNVAYAYSVAGNTDEGWLTVANGNQHPAKLLAVAAVIPAAIAAGVALPAIAKAKAAAQGGGCVANLRMIDAAKQQWALEKKKPETAVPTKNDLLPYLPNGKFPTCPDGGKYKLNAVSEPPECSHPGHELPK